jgi:hypothetical protein
MLFQGKEESTLRGLCKKNLPQKIVFSKEYNTSSPQASLTKHTALKREDTKSSSQLLSIGQPISFLLWSKVQSPYIFIYIFFSLGVVNKTS